MWEVIFAVSINLVVVLAAIMVGRCIFDEWRITKEENKCFEIIEKMKKQRINKKKG